MRVMALLGRTVFPAFVLAVASGVRAWAFDMNAVVGPPPYELPAACGGHEVAHLPPGFLPANGARTTSGLPAAPSSSGARAGGVNVDGSIHLSQTWTQNACSMFPRSISASVDARFPFSGGGTAGLGRARSVPFTRFR